MQLSKARLSSILFCLPILAAAQGIITQDLCNTGSIVCCDFTGAASSSSVSSLLSLLDIAVQDVNGLVGVTCFPISTVGIGSLVCSAQPVCCTNNSFNGIVALGCVPVNLNL
ncbi:fungal hydrophobin [Agrocybe pediades]|nr:fungal hydrophobin [Agrocybe pediades]